MTGCSKFRFLKDLLYDLSTCGQILLKGGEREGEKSKIQTIWDFRLAQKFNLYAMSYKMLVFSTLEIYVLTSKFLR